MRPRRRCWSWGRKWGAWVDRPPERTTQSRSRRVLALEMAMVSRSINSARVFCAQGCACWNASKT